MRIPQISWAGVTHEIPPKQLTTFHRQSETKLGKSILQLKVLYYLCKMQQGWQSSREVILWMSFDVNDNKSLITWTRERVAMHQDLTKISWCAWYHQRISPAIQQNNGQFLAYAMPWFRCVGSSFQYRPQARCGFLDRRHRWPLRLWALADFYSKARCGCINTSSPEHQKTLQKHPYGLGMSLCRRRNRKTFFSFSKRGDSLAD